MKIENKIEVSAGLVFHNGRLLITRRQPGEHLGGLWEFPGGKRKTRETFEESLVRELREELGIKVAVQELLASLTHKYPERTVHLRFFLCSWKSGRLRPLGCSAFKWIGVDELAEHEFPAADARLLKKLRRSPRLWK